MFRFAPVTLVIPFVAAALVAPTSKVEACTCLPNPGIEHVFANAKHVVRVQVRKEVRRIHRIPGIPTMDGTIRVYRAKVKESFKGCMKSGRVIKLVTASDSGLCGVHLDRRKEYVVALGEGDRGAFEVNTCGFVRAASSLSPSETEFLQTRFECCGNRCSCTGTDFVHCFVDPCSLESCGDATCVANHCGGCNAEFFGPAGQPVCTACDNAFDCGAGQTCDGGLCVPDVACVEDADCAADSWCRPSEAGGSSCAPFVGEGETCGGFVLPWTADRCEPGLICAPAPSLPGTPPLPDLPGICTAP